MADLKRGERERLPQRRAASIYTVLLHTDKGTDKCHVTLGWAPDGRLLELFVDTHKAGSDTRFYMGQFAIATSKLLQYGAPVSEALGKLRGHALHAGRIDCDAVAPIHGKPAASMLDAIVQLVEAETDEHGKRRS